ncbi:glycosyltransferase [Photobacterium piscicola]|uniref:glycosyltransferase n=1 Tax=Photobacterium piscicola TaxID=1378299 RepID=UPI002E195FD2|nr:glycosyltransferase [Photobacterium piscicola]
MNILIFFPSIDNGGPTNVVLSLLKGLNKNKNINIHAVYFWGDNDNNLDVINSCCDSIYKLDKVNLKSLYKLLAIIKEIKPDIVHSHCLVPDFFNYILSLCYSYKSVSTLHCNLDEDYINEYGFIKSHSYKFIHKYILMKINNVVSVSKSVLKAIPEVKAKTILNGIEELKTPLYKDNLDVINLLYVGRLIKRKNISFLISCITEINKIRNKKIKLTIVGDGELKSILKIKSGKNISFIDFNDNPFACGVENTFFINPSLSEGMPIAVLEALSLGLPVLLSSIPAHIEINDKMTDGVQLFDFNFESINNAIESMLIDCNNIGYRNKIKSQFQDNFSLNTMSDNYVLEYKLMLEG